MPLSCGKHRQDPQREGTPVGPPEKEDPHAPETAWIYGHIMFAQAIKCW